MRARQPHPFPILAVAASCLVGLAPVLAADAPPADSGVTDEEITLAVEDELQDASEVRAHLVDVGTKDGIVTLDGKLTHQLAKERATELAQQIKGVRAVVNQIQVVPILRSDAELREDLEEAFLYDPAVEAFEVEVEVEQGRVTLLGTVESLAERELARQTAAAVRGVRAIDNRIEVEPAQQRSDQEIASEVRSLLSASAEVDDALLEVAVDAGRVRLSGAVGSAAEKRRADEIARVTGATKVDAGEVEVRWWDREKMRRTAADGPPARAAVADALGADPRVDATRIEVRVDEGTVTLTGQVHDLMAKRAAEADARNTIGVRRVRNHLRVRPQTPPRDEKIAEQIRRALARDPYVEQYGLTVDVDNGHVDLYGAVNTPYEETHAENVAARCHGVVAVDEHLRVDEEWTWHEDWQIADDIRSELFWDPFVDEERIEVAVRGGVATLSGEVGTRSEREHAIEGAFEGGALRVIDELRVVHEPAQTKVIIH